MAPQPPRPPKPVPPIPPAPPKPPAPAKRKQYRLLEDCRSFVRVKTLYGKKHDVVTEVSFSDPVLIVEAKSGERYPIHKSKLAPLNPL